MLERISRRELVAGSVAGLAFGGVARRAHAEERPIPPELVAGKAACKFQLGLVTYNIAKDWDLPTLINRAKTLGLAAVELRTTHKHGVEISLTKAERQAVRKRFADSGLVLWTLGSACEYHSPDPAVVAENTELTKQFIQLAVDVGAKCVKVRPNGLPANVSEGKTLELIGRSLHTVGEAAAAAGVQICCEMHGPSTQEPRRMRRIMELTDHPAVGVTWNSNPVDVKNGSIRESFQMMQPWIRSVHINELTNSYPWRELFMHLRGIGYDRYTMVEIQGLQTKNPNPKDEMRLLGYYRALWEDMSRSSAA